VGSHDRSPRGSQVCRRAARCGLDTSFSSLSARIAPPSCAVSVVKLPGTSVFSWVSGL
jgi:hypothetical protein